MATRQQLMATGFVAILVNFLCASASLAAEAVESAQLNRTEPSWQPHRSLRLPNTTYPLHYDLHIVTNIHLRDFNYKGNVTIEIGVRESTNEIVVHSKELTIVAITVTDLSTGDTFDDLTYTHDARCSFLIIHPVQDYQAFEAGQRLRVEILYRNVMNAKTFGIYWLTYNDRSNRTVYLAATQFEPTSARLAFPCYDEPAFKANFTIRLTHGSNYMAISNMHVKHVEQQQEQQQEQQELSATDDGAESDGMSTTRSTPTTTTTFHTTPPMSTYLVAFVISDFEYIVEEYRGVTQRVFTSSDKANKGQKALKNAVRTVAAIEDYFGINYPLAKLDHIALNKNYGAAMENWGLITYKEDNLIQQNELNMHKHLKDMIIQNHEIAHQWFGNLVSPEWWTYAWLNEGFATYFGYIITDLIHPELKAMEFFFTEVAERAYSYNYINVRPMTYYVEKETDILSVFDIISYQRAACVIKMFHHAFNQKTFVRGVSHFLNNFQYTVANELQLFDSLQEAVDDDPTMQHHKWRNLVREIMLSWTHSEWIPIVSIVRNYEENTITFKQRSKNDNTEEHWWVPLNFATASAPDFESTRVDYFMPPLGEVTVTAEELGITLDRNDWLLANKQQTGFYHVLYDDANLRAIAETLQRNHTLIHPLNRGAIFMDLCPLIENNEIGSVDVIFELLKYLKHEQDFLPWNFVTDTIEFFEKNLYGTVSYVYFKQFINRLVQPIYKQLFDTNTILQLTNLTNTEILVRSNVIELACLADLPECLNFTSSLARDYIFNSVKLDTNMDYYAMHDSILCMGVKYLSDDDFTAMMDMLAKSERESLWYDDLIYSMRCTQSPKHLEQYLDLLFNKNSIHAIMNDTDSMMYLFYLYKSNMAARSVVWTFLKRQYRLLCQKPYNLNFVDNFNRIAEYVPHENYEDLVEFRNQIAAELEANNIPERVKLIAADSPLIGKKVKIREVFLDKFGQEIHDWLMHDQLSHSYAEVAASTGVRNAGNRMGSLVRATEKLLSTFLHSTL